MHIKIGPYKDFYGIYHFTDMLHKIGVSEDRCDKIGNWLAETWIDDACEWADKKRTRNIKVRIDKYDTWSMDTTLAHIILPMLHQLKETKHGCPDVNDEDVPKKLRVREATHHDGETDDNWEARWDWVLDEMIWAFSQMNENEDWEKEYCVKPGEWHFEDKKDGMSEMVWDKKAVIDNKGIKAHRARMQNGFILFGKYYTGLWD
jgi:hypothetical protein